MGVHIIDVVRREAGVVERGEHRIGDAVEIRPHEILGVARRAIADELAERRMAARLRRLQSLEHEHRGALAEIHAVAALGEGPAQIRRQHAQPFPGADACR